MCTASLLKRFVQRCAQCNSLSFAITTLFSNLWILSHTLPIIFMAAAGFSFAVIVKFHVQKGSDNKFLCTRVFRLAIRLL